MIKALLISGLAILLVALVARTVHLRRPLQPVKACLATDTDFIPLSDERLQHFQKAIQFKTVSKFVGDFDREAMKEFGDFLISTFPKVHKTLDWERVNNFSFLYHVKGSNPSLRPYLLMSHLDVVPATNLEDWEVPPFSGKVKDGFIYGRGTIDVKQTAMSILEATEFMLANGLTPVRSYYIAFGHDEEVRGTQGASMLAQRLRERGVTELEFISDEGLPVVHGIISGVKAPVATIGVAEKGFLVIKLSVHSAPGHSSMPPKESTIGILAAAVHRLESNPHPSFLGSSVEKDFFEALVPHMNFGQALMISNIWLFKPLLSWFLSLKHVTNALIRTVTAVVMFNAGIKHNVIPPEATAYVNHRIHPAQTVQQVIDYDLGVINDDRVKMEFIDAMEPHPIAGYTEDDFGYQVLKTSIRQVWTEAVVVPGVMLGNTDSKHYLEFTHNVYRFSPTFMVPGDPERFHGNNERISVKNYEQAINFYLHLIRNSDQVGVSPVHRPHQDL